MIQDRNKAIYKYDKLTISVTREYSELQKLEDILYKLIMQNVQNVENTANCA